MTDQIYSLDGMSPEQVNEARRAGQLSDLLNGRTTPEGNNE